MIIQYILQLKMRATLYWEYHYRVGFELAANCCMLVAYNRNIAVTSLSRYYGNINYAAWTVLRPARSNGYFSIDLL